MRKLAILTVILAGLTTTLLPAADGGVAIVDLDRVAKELGVLESITTKLKNRKIELNAELSTLQKNLQSQMDQAIEEGGTEPNEEQKKKIVTTNRELEIQFQQARNQVAKTLQAEKLKLINDFRNELQPYAMEVAKKRNLNVVLNLAMPPVYAFDSSVDITQDLIASAREAGLEQK